jgi:hypothetical protein
VTIVVGHEPARVNLMIQTLAVFLTMDERRKSRFALDPGTFLLFLLFSLKPSPLRSPN